MKRRAAGCGSAPLGLPVIAEKFVDLYSRSSGLRDKLVAERDVVLTYALHALLESGAAAHLAFKGGTCLRKMVFGSSGRFSEDLDFTLHSAEPDDDVLVRVVEVFNREHHGIHFAFDEYYKTDGDTSFGGEVGYQHTWNKSGLFRFQVSLRERPTLPVAPTAMQHQAYFPHLEFQPFEVPSLGTLEMVAEKIRAAYQRAKVRDLYDLHRFAAKPFDIELLRRLVVVKLWQSRDPFDPEALFTRLRGNNYDWDDLRRLIRASEQVNAAEILAGVETRFADLRNLSALEREVIADAKSGRNGPLADQLREEIGSRWRAG